MTRQEQNHINGVVVDNKCISHKSMCAYHMNFETFKLASNSAYSPPSKIQNGQSRASCLLMESERWVHFK